MEKMSTIVLFPVCADLRAERGEDWERVGLRRGRVIGVRGEAVRGGA